ncbi:hypothetical protein HHK36_017800 [Tetracentron sinense]|uniref:Calcium-transporting P-type ATPase N-terminal autoinhibitory domain-containing protein n=1 Tax=Tetracentron sinense TaxID=13715 RepID=A0A834Z3F1_TETSI|nr:hypothetical protein HHK36_017800 [Tetracentron sinense]
MEKYLKENFDIQSKNTSEEALRKWRSAVSVVKNPQRRFRMITDIVKRNEAAKKKLKIQTNSPSTAHRTYTSITSTSIIYPSIVMMKEGLDCSYTVESKTFEFSSVVGRSGLEVKIVERGRGRSVEIQLDECGFWWLIRILGDCMRLQEEKYRVERCRRDDSTFLAEQRRNANAGGGTAVRKAEGEAYSNLFDQRDPCTERTGGGGVEVRGGEIAVTWKKKDMGKQPAQVSGRFGAGLAARAGVQQGSSIGVPESEGGGCTKEETGVGWSFLKKNQKRNRRRRRLRWERKIQTAGRLEKGFAVYPVLSNVSRRVKEVGGVVQGLGLSEPQVGGLALAEEGPRSPGGDRRADSVVTDGPIERTGPLARSVHTPTGSSGRRLLVVGDSAGPKSSYRPGLAGLEKEAQEDRSSSPGLLNSKLGGLLLTIGEARGNIREQEPMGGGNGALSPSELRFQREGGGSGGAVKGIDHSRRLSFVSEVEAAFVTPEHGVRKAREGSGGPESSVVAEAVRLGGELDGGNCGVYKEGLTGRFWDDGSGGSEFEHYTPLVFGELAGEQEVSGLLAEVPGSSNFEDGGPGVDLGTQPVPYLEQRSPASRVEER